MLQSIKRIIAPMKLSEALEFVKSLQTEGSSTPGWYHTPVNLLIEIIGADIPITDVHTEHIRAWQKEVETGISLRGKRRSLWTQDSYKRGLRAFFNILVKTRHLPYDHAVIDVLRFDSLPAAKPKSLLEEEVQALLSAAKDTKRDYAMMHVLRASGIRLGGLRSMFISELDIVKVEKDLTAEEEEFVALADSMGLDHLIKETEVVEYRGRFRVSEKGKKGRKQRRYARLDHPACVALLDYMETRPHDAPDNLWITSTSRPITENGLYQAFKRVADRAGVDASPHDLRHTFVRRLLAMGIDRNVVAKLSGHASPSVIDRIYGVPRDDEIEDAYNRFAKRARQNGRKNTG